jgi:hypothetical protein
MKGMSGPTLERRCFFSLPRVVQIAAGMYYAVLFLPSPQENSPTGREWQKSSVNVQGRRKYLHSGKKSP